jgi:hypothetical protein
LSAHPDEVADIMQVPLPILFSDGIRRIKDLELGNGVRLNNVPYFDIDGKDVWGATAMMLNEFIDISRDITGG